MSKNSAKTSRTRPRDRCPRCEIRRVLCFCALIPRIETRTRIVILMHIQEKNLSTNTARLATLCMPNAEIRYRGLKDQPTDTSGLVRDGADTIFLYPSEDAEEVTPEFISTLNGPITLVVPDGSWRQAQKVHHREPGLNGIRRVKLPPGPPSEYRLRTEPQEGFVSTFEAIARTLGAIEGPETQRKLEHIFRVKVERTLWARGNLHQSLCTTGIPETALRARGK